MTPERTLDVSYLPDSAFGPRAPLWWGQVGMMAIESTILAIIIAAYFYVRIGFSVWPPPNIAPPDLGLASVNLVILVASCVPMYLSGKAIMQGNVRKATLMTVLNVVMALAFLLIRTIELNRWNFKWTTDIYGSLVWTLVVLHTMHVIGDTIESMVFVGVLLSGRVGAKQQLGAKMDGLYWYWVVAIWIPLYLLIFVYPALTKYA